MPLTLEAGALFAVLIAPGFLLLRGYARRRSRVAPERDLYALAQAVVGSLALLTGFWLALSVLGEHDLLEDLAHGRFAAHETTIFWLLLGLLSVPYPLGWLGAGLADRAGRRPTRVPGSLLRWTGLFEPPASWDAVWLEARKYEWALVSVDFADGRSVLGLLADRSKVDLSPEETRNVFFEQEYRYANGVPEKVEGHGIWVCVSGEAAVRIRGVGPGVS